ncbi:hypothetical protein Lmor_0305 [Legionella moravica]|uniref:Thioesterase (YiiD_Cterm) n=1 Tax=Legionella moravica TaxID=39962 RepID=A0A378K4L9_9GAMM|nr:DUF4442 domain-containing protein [Legionella moravica]KTD38484.1 hypothetical protein Lmor_0305 [Legionella moravica]STX62821.1 Putative thioesterase (yiiD_Cterm) [Legionella moravica]
MKLSTIFRLMRFWPPFWGAGISVKRFNKDLSSIEVQMKMRFWNKNYVGTHYGGSLYSMTDPFYMLMLMNLLGKNYIVWDKSASIRYKIPARGTVFAKFELSNEQIEQFKEEIERHHKIEPEFTIEVKNSDGDVITVVKKVIHISKKKKK